MTSQLLMFLIRSATQSPLLRDPKKDSATVDSLLRGTEYIVGNCCSSVPPSFLSFSQKLTLWLLYIWRNFKTAHANVLPDPCMMWLTRSLKPQYQTSTILNFTKCGGFWNMFFMWRNSVYIFFHRIKCVFIKTVKLRFSSEICKNNLFVPNIP